MDTDGYSVRKHTSQRKSLSPLITHLSLLFLSFTAEEDEEKTNEFVQKVASKGQKSSHDVLNDPKLSKETATFVKVEQDDDDDDDPEEVMAKIRNKLQSSSRSKEKRPSDRTQGKKESIAEEVVPVSDSDSDEFGNELERERRIKRKKKA